MYNRTRESGIQGRPQGLSKLEDSLDYMLSCLKKKKCEKGKKQKENTGPNMVFWHFRERI